MKTRLTDDYLMVEAKGMGAYRIRNRLIFVVASNEERSVPADIGDRRWMIFPVSSRRQEDHDFFKRLTRQMREGGGLAAMLYDLLERDITVGPNPRRVIRSEALLDISLDTGDPILRYLRDLLQIGVLPGSRPDAPNRSSAAQMFIDFKLKEPGERVKSGALGWKLSKVFGAISQGQMAVPGYGRSIVYAFPPLDVCRRMYADFVRTPIVWDPSAGWTPADDVPF